MDDLPLDPELQDRLRQWEAPHPTPAQTTRLIETLAAHLPEARLQRNAGKPTMEWAPLLLMRSQMRVVRSEIWVASALVMGLGTMVTLATYQPDATHVLPLTALAPLVAAGGVALLYDSDLEAVLELESATPTSVRLLLLARRNVA